MLLLIIGVVKNRRLSAEGFSLRKKNFAVKNQGGFYYL